MTATPDVHGEPVGSERSEESPVASTTGRLPGRAVAAVLIAVLVAKSAAPVRDADTFWHLASGRQIVRDWTLVGPDPLSPFTLSPWIRHAWLPDVGFHLLDVAGGPRLVALALPVMAATAVVVLYIVLRQFGGRMVSAVLLALAFLAMSASVSLRPQVLSFAGTAAVTGLWLIWVRGGRTPWTAVPLTWLWACCHGLWLLSPVIGAAVVVGVALDRRSARGLARPALVVCASAAAGALTPVGPALLLAPLQVRAIAPYIQEWQPAGILSLPLCAVWVILAMDVIASVRLRRRPSWSHLALVILAVVLALNAARTVGIAGIIAACASIGTIQQALPLGREPWTRAELTTTLTAATVGVALGAAVIWAGAQSVVGYPATSFATLQKAPRGTVVCAEYEVGSWLLWRHPGTVPTMDGRTEIYSPRQLEAALALANGAPGSLDEIRGTTDCRYAAVRATGPAAELLSAEYHRAEVDGQLALYDLDDTLTTR